MRFYFTDLNRFRHIVDAGSITAGARQANLALASASERISNIESDAGVDAGMGIVTLSLNATPTPSLSISVGGNTVDLGPTGISVTPSATPATTTS